MTPTFVGIGSGYSVQDVKLVGDNVTGWGDQSLQILDSEGNVQDEDFFTWFNATEAYKTAPAGWFDENLDPVDREIDPGQAFIIENGEGEYVIQFAGQVVMEGIPAYECQEGFTSIGNLTPIAKNIQLYALAGENATGWGDQSLQILDSEGNVPDEDFFTWFNATEAYKTAPAGWFDENLDQVDRDIEPGQSFLIENGEGEYTVSIPGVNTNLD